MLTSTVPNGIMAAVTESDNSASDPTTVSAGAIVPNVSGGSAGFAVRYMADVTHHMKGDTRPYKSVRLSAHPAVIDCLRQGLPTYQAYLAQRKQKEKRDWIKKKQEEIVTTFGPRQLSKYSAEDIRKVTFVRGRWR